MHTVVIPTIIIIDFNKEQYQKTIVVEKNSSTVHKLTLSFAILKKILINKVQN